MLDRRLADLHGLEAALQRGVLLDVLAVLVERGGADGLQLARGQLGFRIDAASIAPSAAPAPTSVCNSSMNKMMSPRVLISFSTFFKRSSKSPR
ncbi:ATP-dependent Clp protease ATP-binding subunit ClpC domain protein [Mycobacterium xenopi 3993]|nr:ATP-dependent Clp protease ATP-binding subunit ClpC domain protein [Mycobacterium xenopi 3993]